MQGMVMRNFAYSDVFRHSAGGKTKNESNCTVFLKDGTWFTTWSQGSHERSPDEKIVGAFSRNKGKSWSEPFVILEPEYERELTFSSSRASRSAADRMAAV